MADASLLIISVIRKNLREASVSTSFSDARHHYLAHYIGMDVMTCERTFSSIVDGPSCLPISQMSGP